MGGKASIPEQHNHHSSQSYDFAPAKFRYHRPEFLRLTDEQLQQSRNHSTRTIISPDYQLPRLAGFAE